MRGGLAFETKMAWSRRMRLYLYCDKFLNGLARATGLLDRRRSSFVVVDRLLLQRLEEVKADISPAGCKIR